MRFYQKLLIGMAIFMIWVQIPIAADIVLDSNVGINPQKGTLFVEEIFDIKKDYLIRTIVRKLSTLNKPDGLKYEIPSFSSYAVNGSIVDNDFVFNVYPPSRSVEITVELAINFTTFKKHHQTRMNFSQIYEVYDDIGNLREIREYEHLHSYILIFKSDSMKTCKNIPYFTNLHDTVDVKFPNWGLSPEKIDDDTIEAYFTNEGIHKNNVSFAPQEITLFWYEKCSLEPVTYISVAVVGTILLSLIMLVALVVTVVFQLQYRRSDRKRLSYFQMDTKYLDESTKSVPIPPMKMKYKGESNWKKIFCCGEKILLWLLLATTKNQAFTDPQEYPIPDDIAAYMRSSKHLYIKESTLSSTK